MRRIQYAQPQFMPSPLCFPFTRPSLFSCFLLVVDKLLWFGDAVCEHPSKILPQSSISKLCGFLQLVHTNILANDMT